MADRLKGVTVTFAEDLRVEDAEAILNAIRMIKGVIDVQASVTNPDDHMTRALVRMELRARILKVLD
jgi:hypothetical protein